MKFNPAKTAEMTRVSLALAKVIGRFCREHGVTHAQALQVTAHAMVCLTSEFPAEAARPMIEQAQQILNAVLISEESKS